jgi:hypothetical protein
VSAQVSERTGALVIRVWIEGSPRPQLRARITRTLDVASGDQVSTGATSTQQIEAVVHAWLESFANSIEMSA